ncbi:GAF domain-containing sensor histidine kinase [Thalassotalea sp. LPB0316]|uniref:GAF domain-containing sensor histidine kinase n=1 Tax=Thalassotalea sp. LPB0316 TaxID=2769490 RepID=UPI0018670CD7|nr:GAF domain-containing sensor histidine kinase [Thalassotalea sp. LPB0316]QOL26857.1 GAF domain-containing sensor histidine kinase [Thalassotalea sp. LPB0316]
MPSAREARLEKILAALFELDKYFPYAKSLVDYIEKVHNQLNSLVYAENFYLAKYNKQDNTISFIYEVDERENALCPIYTIELSSPDLSPTAWVIKHKKPLEMKSGVGPVAEKEGEMWGFGERSHHWLGMPLIDRNNECLGAMVIQSYNENIDYSDEDQRLFRIFGSIVASAVDKHTRVAGLELLVIERTEQLEKQLREKEHSEKLQVALYQIASLVNDEIPMSQLYIKVHEIIKTLLLAKNFYIALFDEAENIITIPYYIDEKEPDREMGFSLPLGNGLSSYIIKTRQAQRVFPQDVEALVRNGFINEVAGPQEYSCWLGAPMISSNIVHGLIVVQSYDADVIYSEEDMKLLNFVANHVAKAAESMQNKQMRKDSQLKLARQHRVLEQQNRDLNETLNALKKTQQELIQKEKMASLGGLVAGIAHEINTPLGICVTGVSHLMEEYHDVKKSLEEETLTQDQLDDFFDEIKQVGQILTTNMQRAADLVNSFKQVAVDQSSNSVRDIELEQYINGVILSLRPTLKKKKHIITVQCPTHISIRANAGALSQVLSNLILNSYIHAFEGIEQGNILIHVEERNGFILMRYQDDGNGLDNQALEKLFDPFYTTKRGSGGSGLGTHLVYNLVTNALHGKIQAKSAVGKGLAFMIKFPVSPVE